MDKENVIHNIYMTCIYVYVCVYIIYNDIYIYTYILNTIIYIMEYYLATKKKNLPFTTTWIDLEHYAK